MVFLIIARQIGIGLFIGPKRFIRVTSKPRFSRSSFTSSSVISVGIPLRTTFRVRSSGILNVWHGILFCRNMR